MTDSSWSDMASAYVLDALDAEERLAFEERLAADEELASVVAAERELLHAIAGDLPLRTPRPELRARILADAVRDRAGREGAASQGGKARGPDIGGAGRGSRPFRWLAAASVILAVALGALLQRQRERGSDLQALLEATTAQLATTEGQLAQRDSLLATFLGADVRTAVLSGTDQPPSARLYWNTATSTMLVAVFDVPAAAAGRTYQLWGIPEGANPVSLGTFQTGPDGTAVALYQAPDGAQFQLGAVTEEPAGGSPQPTSAPFLVGSWTQD